MSVDLETNPWDNGKLFIVFWDHALWAEIWKELILLRVSTHCWLLPVFSRIPSAALLFTRISTWLLKGITEQFARKSPSFISSGRGSFGALLWKQTWGIKPLSWQTSVYDCVAFSEWKIISAQSECSKEQRTEQEDYVSLTDFFLVPLPSIIFHEPFAVSHSMKWPWHFKTFRKLLLAD